MNTGTGHLVWLSLTCLQRRIRKNVISGYAQLKLGFYLAVTEKRALDTCHTCQIYFYKVVGNCVSISFHFTIKHNEVQGVKVKNSTVCRMSSWIQYRDQLIRTVTIWHLHIQQHCVGTKVEMES